ncbi:MAG TPA: prepilin-type N-terminal cleavage/methylation domain-containing protein [Candidatus Nitrosopolaris sp.]|nr:prepilin-type N-terminal cleavage/methylation domain-containing protein [Candidatus Nitrosopolaris sp.]
MTRRRRNSRGFSLAEVLAGTALTMMLMTALYSVQRAQSKAFASQSVYAESQNVTRTVIDLMTRELRMATYDPGTALTTSPGPTCPGVKQGIVEATPSKIHFRQDLTGDGSLVSPGEDLVYDVLGSDLRRTDGTALPVTIVTGVPAGGLNFRYFDGSNPPNELVPTGVPPALTASQRDCVTKVRITVQANLTNPDPNNSMPIPSVAETEVAIRNRSLSNF